MLHKIIFWFRVFNSFLGKTTSGLSIGAIGVPIILTAIIGGFFGFPIVVPLIVIYSIIAALALGARKSHFKSLCSPEQNGINSPR